MGFPRPTCLPVNRPRRDHRGGEEEQVCTQRTITEWGGVARTRQHRSRIDHICARKKTSRASQTPEHAQSNKTHKACITQFMHETWYSHGVEVLPAPT